MLNSGWSDSSLCWPTSVLRTFAQYLIVFCIRLETASDVISGKFDGPIVPDKCVKFRDPRLNRSGEIQPKAVGSSIFGRFLISDNCRPKIAGDVISAVVVEYIGMDVPVKFGDSKSNGSWDIRGADFFTNEWTNMTEAYGIKRLRGVSPEKQVAFH